MKGLLIKEFYSLRGSLLFMLALAAIMAAGAMVMKAEGNIMGIFMIILAMMPFTSLSLDERAKWTRFALTTRVSRNMLVAGKYVSGFLLNAVAFVLGIATSALSGALRIPGTLLSVVAYTTLAVYMQALSFPLLLKFGSEKSRIVMMTLLMLVTFTIMASAEFIGVALEDLSDKPVLTLAFALAPVAYALSIFASLDIYRKKEFS